MVDALDRRLHGSRASLFVHELLVNSCHFPLANLFFEFAREGREVFFAPDLYTLIFACLLQAWVISGWGSKRGLVQLLGNLIGPAVYTLIEWGLEGVVFFSAGNHLLYIVFGASIGMAQAARLACKARWSKNLMTLGEGLLRGLALFGLYAVLESPSAGKTFDPVRFLVEPTHVYLSLSFAALGLLLGLTQIYVQLTQGILRETAERLSQLSAWAFGRERVADAVEDQSSLYLRAGHRAIVFADLRGFTAWSDRHSPEAVVAMLNRFYETVEGALNDHALSPLKVKFTADEAMLVFQTEDDAWKAAFHLSIAVSTQLAPEGLAVGCGVHSGPTVEGLLGSHQFKLFDVIGDTVNVAKRLCDEAGPGEVLVSSRAGQRTHLPATGTQRTLVLKGKPEPIDVTVLRVVTPDGAPAVIAMAPDAPPPARS